MVREKLKVKLRLIYILLLLIFFSPLKINTTLVGYAQEKDSPGLSPSPPRLELSLEDCLLKALRNNLSLKAEMITPQIADKNVTLATKSSYLLLILITISKAQKQRLTLFWMLLIWLSPSKMTILFSLPRIFRPGALSRPA